MNNVQYRRENYLTSQMKRYRHRQVSIRLLLFCWVTAPAIATEKDLKGKSVIYFIIHPRKGWVMDQSFSRPRAGSSSYGSVMQKR